MCASCCGGVAAIYRARVVVVALGALAGRAFSGAADVADGAGVAVVAGKSVGGV